MCVQVGTYEKGACVFRPQSENSSTAAQKFAKIPLLTCDQRRYSFVEVNVGAKKIGLENVSSLYQREITLETIVLIHKLDEGHTSKVDGLDVADIYRTHVCVCK